MITLGPINFGMLMSEGKEKDLTGHLGVMNIQKVTETILDNGHIEKWFLRFFFNNLMDPTDVCFRKMKIHAQLHTRFQDFKCSMHS